MAAGDATWNPLKGVAYRVTFPILDADGDLVTGATGLDSEVSKDGGTFADCTNEATEIATSSGVYYLDLTATEMNADTVAIIVKTSSSGAKTTVLVMYPLEAADMPVNVASVTGAVGSVTGNVGGNVVGSVASVTGAVGSVTGSVGSVTGNVGGNVVGSVASVTGTVTANTTQLAGQTVTAAAGVTFPGTVSSLTAAGVRTELSTELGRIDVATSTRLATSGYTAPLDAAGTRSAVGLASANLDTQFAAIPTVAGNAAGVWNALIASYTVTGSFGQRVLRSTNTQAEVQVNGNGHVASVLHSTEPDSIVVGAFAAGAIDAAALATDAVTEIANGLLDLTNGVETGLTVRQALRLDTAALCGKSSGFPGGPGVFRNVGDTKARITATVDGDGNRTAVTTDAT